MKKHSNRAWGWAAVLAALGTVAAPAFAEVDAKCVERWNKAVTLASMAQQCKLGDAATAAKLKQVEDSSLQCATERASAGEKTEINDTAVKGKAKMKSDLSGMPCNDDAKKFFEREVAALK